MAEDRASNLQVPMDLLAALTAYGLAESAQQVLEPPRKVERRRNWLAGWLGASDVRPDVPAPKGLDAKWAGGSYALRFLDLVLLAHR